MQASTNQRLPNFEEALSTRNFCLVGLVATAIGSVASFSVGGILWKRQRVIYNGITDDYEQTPTGFYSTSAKEIASLLLNVYITACSESLGFIHAASLRWTLYREGRLKYNSNLHLFTSAKHSYANGRCNNILWAVSLALSYASVSQFILPNSPDSLFPGYIYNPAPLIILGFSLLFQCLLAIWCLIPSEKRKILSWNSTPLNTTIAYCHMNGSSNTRIRIAIPATRQRSAFQSIRRIRHVLIALWSLVPITVLWGVLIWFLAIKDLGKRDTSFSPNDDTGGFYPGTYDMDNYSSIAVNTLIIGMMQLIYTMALHIAELAVNTSRDESQWRKASILNRGIALSVSSLTVALTSWETVVLLILKPVGHWIFGLSCLSFWYGWIAFHPIPIFCLSGFAFLLATLVTVLLLKKPFGPQPSTYGDLQLLSTFIDDWRKEENGRLYWGDKGYFLDPSRRIVRIAGTSAIRQNLASIRMQEPYWGLKVEAVE
ncbi:hypothetical protein DM02DRAFT_635311 [Periconia macrospinosa]|uniref:Uncharacterized protein n=1 Tax=Periconia macrospinosa TaxID=97972 RepID=A0A2V1D4R8_9PLEO|nr:hypothetical protein DM02DRAFT_635311 [Periconia macrospinosa]